MANRIVINICGEEYTFVSDDSPAYLERVANHVSHHMTEILESARVGRTDAAVLAAANITDELYKCQQAGEQLRGQIKAYLDQAAQAQHEVSELKREVFRLQQQLGRQS